MGRGNVATLSFEGDASGLSKVFDKVGADSKQMADNVDKSSSAIGESIEGSSGKFRGLGDAVGGSASVMEGFRTGNVEQLAMGFADLADGIGSVVLPMLSTLAAKIGLTTIATNIMTTAQGALNFVMALNPITLVVIALVALAAAFVVAYQHSETFRDVVKGVFNAIKTAGETVFEFLKRGWNNTVGGFGFSVPSWVPGIGGNSFRIPEMHSGGIVPGAPGTEMLALLQAGERVTPAARAGQGGGGITIIVQGSVIHERQLGRVVADALRDNRLVGVTA